MTISKEDIKKMIEELDTFSKQKDKLATKNENLITQAKELIIISNKLKEIAKELDPVVSVSSTGERSRLKKENTNLIMHEVYEKMKSGVHITSEMIQKAYPDLNLTQNNLSYIMDRIKQLPGVKKTKDGIQVRLFYHE